SEEYMLRNIAPTLGRFSLSAGLFASGLGFSTGFAAGQEPKALHVMPLPRSVQVGSGMLTLDDKFYAGAAGKGDERLSAALDRFLVRLDRACGGIRRAQFTNGAGSAPVLTV